MKGEGGEPLISSLSSAAAADALPLPEGERRPLPDVLQRWLPASLLSGLLRLGTRSDGWGCFASLHGALIGSSLPVQQEEVAPLAGDLLKRVTWWDAPTLRTILEPVPPELRDSATYDLFSLSSAELEQQQAAVHSQLQQYVHRYLDGRIMSSGLEMLRLCQAECLASSAVTVYVMQLQPAAAIVKLLAWNAPTCAVFLLQHGAMPQVFQIVLQPADSEKGTPELVRFPLLHPLVVEAERWLEQQQHERKQRSRAEADWRRQGGKQEAADDEEEKRPQRGESDEEEEEDKEENWQDAASEPGLERSAEQPSARRRSSASSSALAAVVASQDGDSDAFLCPHNCGCDDEVGCRLRIPGNSGNRSRHLRDMTRHRRCTVECSIWKRWEVDEELHAWLLERAEWMQSGWPGDGPALPKGLGEETYINIFTPYRNNGRRTGKRKKRRSTAAR